MYMWESGIKRSILNETLMNYNFVDNKYNHSHSECHKLVENVQNVWIQILSKQKCLQSRAVFFNLNKRRHVKDDIIRNYVS